MSVRRFMRCPDCQGPMKLRPGQYGHYYACLRWPECKGSHGAHPNGEPKGFPGNAPTRAARVKAHEAFDELWKGGEMERSHAYGWMRRVLGLTRRQAHIAKFTEAQCRQLIACVRARGTASSA